VVPVVSRRELVVVILEGGAVHAEALQLELTPLDGPREERTRSLGRGDGTYRFFGLEPGASYWLWAGPTPSGRHVHVAVGPETREVTASLVPGLTIRGTVRGSAEGFLVEVADRGIHVETEVQNGAFQLVGVPPGTWTVVLVDGSPAQRRQAVAGGTVTFDVAER
jgi:hypothetical protein